MIVETFHRKCPLKHQTEDAFTVNEKQNVYAVFDGVTPIASISSASTDEHIVLNPSNVEAGDEARDNDARKASQLFQAHFSKSDVSQDMAHELLLANAKLGQAMEAAGVDLRQRHLLWSTCAAAVYVGEEYINYAQIGDCMVVTVSHNGDVNVLTQDHVTGITKRAQLHREAARNEGTYVPEEPFFEQTPYRQAYNRWMANTPEGYGVANGRPEMRDFIQTGQIIRTDLKALLLVSDGLFWPKRDLVYVTREIERIGLQTYGEQLIAYEEKHELYADDKTGIRLQFN